MKVDTGGKDRKEGGGGGEEGEREDGAARKEKINSCCDAKKSYVIRENQKYRHTYVADTGGGEGAGEGGVGKDDSVVDWLVSEL